MPQAGFSRQNGALCIDGLRLDDIANQFGTPIFVYSATSIEANFTRLTETLGGGNRHIHYAMKANSNLAVLKVVQRLGGIGVDIVSLGEFRRALAAGFTPGQMIYSGVGKTHGELAETIAAGIGQINAESEAEIDTILDIARDTGYKPPVALRINPDINAGGHAKISTGKSDDKFGISADSAPACYRRMADSGYATPKGLAVHIGSQIMDCDSFTKAWEQMLTMAEALRHEGYSVPSLDLGGGIGIDYKSGDSACLASFSDAIAHVFGNFDYQLAIEPGRLPIAEAGALITTVINRKTLPHKRFIIVDAAMNDLIRPTLYEAYHRIEPIKDAQPAALPADVVGPVCETGDYLGLDRSLPDLEAGDRLAVMSAGAYAAVMRSNYNTRPMAGEIMVIDGQAVRVSRPQTVDDLIAADIIPPQLKTDS